MKFTAPCLGVASLLAWRKDERFPTRLAYPCGLMFANVSPPHWHQRLIRLVLFSENQNSSCARIRSHSSHQHERALGDYHCRGAADLACPSQAHPLPTPWRQLHQAQPSCNHPRQQAASPASPEDVLKAGAFQNLREATLYISKTWDHSFWKHF